MNRYQKTLSIETKKLVRKYSYSYKRAKRIVLDICNSRDRIVQSPSELKRCTIRELVTKVHDSATRDIIMYDLYVVVFEYLDGATLTPGDYYIAKRRNVWRLGKCSRVEDGKVIPESVFELQPYDCRECRKVKAILNYTDVICNGLDVDGDIVYVDDEPVFVYILGARSVNQ